MPDTQDAPPVLANVSAAASRANHSGSVQCRSTSVASACSDLREPQRRQRAVRRTLTSTILCRLPQGRQRGFVLQPSRSRRPPGYARRGACMGQGGDRRAHRLGAAQLLDAQRGSAVSLVTLICHVQMGQDRLTRRRILQLGQTDRRRPRSPPGSASSRAPRPGPPPSSGPSNSVSACAACFRTPASSSTLWHVARNGNRRRVGVVCQFDHRHDPGTRRRIVQTFRQVGQCR